MLPASLLAVELVSVFRQQFLKLILWEELIVPPSVNVDKFTFFISKASWTSR
jgi:hypothetical protein